ncbi:MAG: hypothetical protein NHG11_00035 [Candidatus Shikimatogenerans bostrichidophilus]|nr:MAG: hypothetical protein NHG11_00035 [Candidatus Shikimatogenerans bostrichidophilus]
MLKKKKWYILKIKNNYEDIIINKIEKKIKKKIKKKYYLGYLMIKIFLNKKIFFFIKNIEGVSYFLNERINKLPLNINNNNYYKKKNINYKKKKKYNIGETIIIKKGIFKNKNGKINKIYKKKKKIEILILILGKIIPIKIKIDQIKKKK